MCTQVCRPFGGLSVQSPNMFRFAVRCLSLASFAQAGVPPVDMDTAATALSGGRDSRAGARFIGVDAGTYSPDVPGNTSTPLTD